MKKNYYLIGSTIGLGFALVMGYWIMKKSLWDMMFSFEKYNGFVPILTGVVATIRFTRMPSHRQCVFYRHLQKS